MRVKHAKLGRFIRTPMMVSKQVAEHMEKNGLIPETQHGFKAKRSTQTAWAQIQQDWANNTEGNQVTGVLMWDLSAAFDTFVVLIRECLDVW